jgi:hypothetical protein
MVCLVMELILHSTLTQTEAFPMPKTAANNYPESDVQVLMSLAAIKVLEGDVDLLKLLFARWTIVQNDGVLYQEYL